MVKNKGESDIMSNFIKDAIYLIDDEDITSWGGLRSGWDYIKRGEGPSPLVTRDGCVLNSDKDGETYLRRETNPFDGGILTIETRVDNQSGNGLFFKFGSRDKEFFELHVDGNVLYTGTTGVCGFEYGVYNLIVKLDMLRSKAKVYVNRKYKGEYDFCCEAFTFNCVRVGYGYADRGSIKFLYMRAYVNYLVHDFCYDKIVGEMPDMYTVKSNGAKVCADIRVQGKSNTCYFIKAAKGESASYYTTFDKSCDVVAFETKYHTAGKNGKVTISLKNGDATLISVYDEGDALMFGDTLLRSHSKNVWQTLRIEADTRTNKALIWLNGKKTKTVDFIEGAQFADKIELGYEANKKSDAMFCDTIVWVKPDEPEDYVPAPVIPKKKGDYVVGMNICSLWHEGSHFGWDAITPFDDVKPVLGWYDEGLPETADWEIKFMAEHGIDYELYCWYSSEGEAPMKGTGLSFAIHQGHFHAKYADCMKLALLWEAANCQHPKGLECFKKYLVPYWIDYFFSDPRYVRVDNKAVMSCFGVNHVEEDLGGEANVREGLQYLRDEVKKLGYDDLIILGCHANPYDLKRLGFDGFHAYHWGRDGYKLDCNKKQMNDYMSMNQVHIIPTVSVGFKNVGWGGERSPLLSNQDMYEGLVYCRDELLPTFEKNSWKSKMLHLSTWNEYGEGTYMMPSGLNGFGYLDSVRKAVCEDVPHTDVVPTEEQLKRINYLHVPTRARLARTKYDTRPLPTNPEVAVKYEFKTKEDLAKWTFDKVDSYEIKDGKLYGKASQPRCSMTLKGCKLDTSEIAYVNIKLGHTNAQGGTMHMQFSYANNADNIANGQHMLAWVFTHDTDRDNIFQLDDKAVWGGIVDGIMIEPLFGTGEFVVESVEFIKAVPHKTLYNKDGSQMCFGDYLPEINGELYIPLDPASGILKYYEYEWKKFENTIEVFDKDNKYTFVIGKAYATKNGENFTLIRPTYLKDGIPTVAFSDLCKLWNMTYEEKGNKIFLK